MKVQSFNAAQLQPSAPNRPTPSSPPPVEPEESVSLGEKIGDTFGKIGRWLGNAAEKVDLILSVGPALGHLVVANEINRVEANVFGKERVSAVDWMRVKTPWLYKSNAEGILNAASKPIENSMGLSLEDLLEVEKHFYRALAPVENAAGVRSAPQFMQELAAAPFRPPGTPYSAFVFLGEDRKDEAKMIMDLWNGGTRPPENPFDEGSEHHRMWGILEDIAADGKLPIFLDLDGDAWTFTGTEFIAKRTLSSMVERNNNFGDGFRDAGLYYSWLTTRMDSYYQSLAPWITQGKPELNERIEHIKQDLRPDWLGGKGLGPWPTANGVSHAYGEVVELGEHVGENTTTAEGLCNFADMAVSLDRDLLSGVQTHWIKLLREIGSERRTEVLTPLERAWIHLNIIEPDHPDFDSVSPPHAPLLWELEGPPARINRKPYDRSLALGEVVDHSLDALGITERKDYVDQIQDGIRAHTQEILKREGTLRRELAGRYPGLDIQSIMDGNFNVHEANRRLTRLKATLEDNQLERSLSQQVARHYSLMDWMVNADVRYGDVDLGLAADAPIFKDDPLAVSEFYEPVDNPNQCISILSKGPEAALQMKQASDPQPVMGVSQVFEGGGGRGFAYVEALQQVYNNLHAADGVFRIDEFVGTSAGSHVALFRAAGFEVSELKDVLEEVDFKTFNSDAVWLMGGVDPKVRGVNRNGIFSMQKMYQTFYELLSEKLGIEGRPILFSDLPKNLKLVTVCLNTDLPEDDPLRDLIDEDGRFVMSSENTPNFDVVGAVIASSAVPAYFQAPQIEIARQYTKADGTTGINRYRMQLTDGGVVDNLSFSSAKSDTDKRALMVLPVHYETTDPATGEKVSLETLNFDTANLPIIDAHNRQLYSNFAPQLSDVLTESQKRGTERVVLAFNLSTEKAMPKPALQGATPDQTTDLFQLADELEFRTLDRSESKTLIEDTLSPPSLTGKVAGFLFDTYVDGPHPEDNNLERMEDGSRVILGRKEEENVLDLGRAAGASALAASDAELADRIFEKPV